MTHALADQGRVRLGHDERPEDLVGGHRDVVLELRALALEFLDPRPEPLGLSLEQGLRLPRPCFP
jgi:hypothetical protein